MEPRPDAILWSYASDLQRRSHLAPLATEFYALAPRRQRVRVYLEYYYARWAQELARLLDEGVESAEFRIHDCASTARTLMELFDDAFLVWTLHPEDVDLPTRMLAAFELARSGLTGPPAESG